MATIPGSGCPVEKYMAVAPIQSTAAGFTPRDVFITQGDDIFKFSGGVVTPFVTVRLPRLGPHLGLRSTMRAHLGTK